MTSTVQLKNTDVHARNEASTKSTATWIKKAIWLFLILCGVAIAAYVYLNKLGTDTPNESSKKSSGPPVFSVLDPFTVNLQPEGQFLQASFTLQLGSSQDAETLKNYLPQVRSTILMHLANKHVEELSHHEGKQRLIEEITQKVQAPIDADIQPIKVLNVFITAFVIQ